MSMLIKLLDQWCDFLELIKGRPIDYLEGGILLAIGILAVISVICLLVDSIKSAWIRHSKNPIVKRYMTRISRGFSVLLLVLVSPAFFLFAAGAMLLVNRSLLKRKLKRSLRILFSGLSKYSD